MEFNLTSGFNINQTTYYWFENGFSEEEVLWIDNLKNFYPYEFSTKIKNEILEGPTSLESNILVRGKNISYFNKKDKVFDNRSIWLYDKFKNFSIEANNAIWGFNLHSIIDPIQYVEHFEGSEYKYQIDIGLGNSHRKISIIAQLSDPSEYEGGDIEVFVNGEFLTMPRIQGSVILFPSFLLHKMSPVTKGVKKMLVFWIGGECFK